MICSMERIYVYKLKLIHIINLLVDYSTFSLQCLNVLVFLPCVWREYDSAAVYYFHILDMCVVCALRCAGGCTFKAKQSCNIVMLCIRLGVVGSKLLLWNGWAKERPSNGMCISRCLLQSRICILLLIPLCLRMCIISVIKM